MAGPTGLTLHKATFTRRDVLQALCDRLPYGATVGELETLADAFLTHAEVVEVAAQPHDRGRGAGGLRRGDGRLVPAANADGRRYTSTDLLELEAATVEAAARRRNDQAAVTSDTTMAAALAAHTTADRTPSTEQAAMVATLVTGGHGVAVVNAAAGAGKTFTLRICQTAWRAAGYRVVGAALAAQAAHTLTLEGEIPAQTIARLLADLDGHPGGNRGGFAPNTVLVVDEAGMVGTRDLARLLDHADRAGAKVVLVGDAEQLPEIDAGGLFRELLEVLDPVELTENRRQVAAWEQAALRQLRTGETGDIAQAVAAYQANGRLVVAGTSDGLRERLVADWWQAYQDVSQPGREPVMIALRRADVADLNDLARVRLRAAGRLGAEQLVVGERTFAVGDRVVTLRNAARRYGVLNGTRGIITSVDLDAGALVMRTDDGRSVRLPASYLRPRGLGRRRIDHAYAVTGHKVQGATVDHAFVLGGDELYRQWGYTALSRARFGTWLYVPAGAHVLDVDVDFARQPDRDPIQALITALGDDRAQMLASAHPRQPSSTGSAQVVPDIRTDLAGDGGLTLDPAARLRARLDQLARAHREAAGWLAEAHDRYALAMAHARRGTRLDRANASITTDVADRQRLVAQLDAELGVVDRQLAVSAGTSLPSGGVGRSRSPSPQARLGDQLERDPPRWLVATLGGLPHHPAARAAWRTAAVELSLYRARHRIRDPANALGPAPAPADMELEHAGEHTALIGRLQSARRAIEIAEQASPQPKQVEVAGRSDPELPGRWLDESP